MGFWGWPLAQPDRALLACRAALAIQRELASSEAAATLNPHPFQVGIGIASGAAVAGQIGSADQAKVTVFGPVPNLAARLESLTARLGADILLDESTANLAANNLGDVARLHRVASIVPYGLQTPLAVSRLLPPGREWPGPSAAALANYDAAYEDFLAGRWVEAQSLLKTLTLHDPAAAFLLDIIGRQTTPPPGFDGVIRLTTK
jgi:adenylate cyclase